VAGFHQMSTKPKQIIDNIMVAYEPASLPW